MNTLTDRVVVVTSAVDGIGREHARLLAAEGARVVVNASPRSADGDGGGLARRAVDEIVAAGGRAIATSHDVTDWDGARRLIERAVDAFGDLHVLVNNTTLLRDRMLVNMSEADWDEVIEAHVKGHFCPIRHAAEYWREQQRAGRQATRAVVNTSSTSGLFGAVGQGNVGTAKMGIAALTIVAAQELARYHVRVNAVAPAALSGLTAQLVGIDGDGRGDSELCHPANVSPFVAYLATEDCPISGRVFVVVGGEVHLLQPWTIVDGIEKQGRWSVEELAVHAPRLASVPLELGAHRMLYESERLA